MLEKTKLYYLYLKNKLTVKKPWDMIIIFVLNILLTIPVFIIAHQNLIDWHWTGHLDRILIFLFILIAIQLILRAFRRITLISIGIYLIILIIGTIFGGYGFKRVFDDYKYMLYYMAENNNPENIIISKLLPFPNKSKVERAIEFENPRVRNFAIMSANKHFKSIKGYSDYSTLIQCFAVFKEINSRWTYVSDPKGKDYIATASESLNYLSGDCDDHSILMAACIKSIGGTPRLIHTDGHIYPEILIGSKKDFEEVNFIIQEVLFKEEVNNQSLHYHIDEYNQIWLNLDYTAKYPGGPSLNESILGALTLY